MVLLDRSTMGPECKFSDWGHPFKSLLASSIAEAGPGPGGSSSLSPSLLILSICICLSLSQPTIISQNPEDQTQKAMENFIECLLGI